MKRFLVILGFVAGMYGLVWSAVTPASTDHVDYCTGANNSNCVFQIQSDGTMNTAAGVGVAGNTALTGTLAVTGATTLTGTLTNNGLRVSAPSSYRVIATSTIVPTSSYLYLVSTGANLYMSGKPIISTATTLGGGTQWADGTQLIVTSTSGIMIQLPNVTNASTSLLYFSSATRMTTTDQNIEWNDRVICSTCPAVFLIYRSTPNAWFGLY